MNMEKVIRFKTMIGYCYLYPDRIIMARNGNPEEVNLKNEEQRLWKHLVFYTITGLLLAWLAYMDRDHLPMCLWLGLTSAWLLFNVLRSIFQKSSSSALIERDKIRSVQFKKGVRYLTRSRFIVVFEDTLPELLVVLPEKGQQGKRLLTDSQHGILYLLRRDESKAVLYPSVMLPDFPGQIVYGAVDSDGILAASVSPSLFRIPYARIDRNFRSYLFPFCVYAYLAQQLARSVLADFGAVYVEQYCECTATPYFSIVCISFH